jgi:hypothetical protein
MIEEHATRRAALRTPIPGGWQVAAYAAALGFALPAGVLAGRALAPDPVTRPAQADTSRDLARQRLASVMTTLDRARAGRRAELRQARTPNGQEQAARRLAHAHSDAAASLGAVPGATALIRRLKGAERAYADLARAAHAGAATRYAAARRSVEREEAGLAAAVAAGVAPVSRPGIVRPAAASGTPLAVFALLLGLAAAAGVVLWPGRRPAAPTTQWNCEISWRSGLRHSCFRAIAAGPGREPLVIARSPNVEWPPLVPLTPEGEALAAARGLARRLQAAGWTPTTREPHWYSQQFEWPGDEDPEPLPVSREGALPPGA